MQNDLESYIPQSLRPLGRSSRVTARGSAAGRVFACSVGLMVAGGTCLGQAGLPPAVNGSYALVYEDNFSTDTSYAGGELKNVWTSSIVPSRPDWRYRSGTTLGCIVTPDKTNVFLSPTAGKLPGLVISDVASSPGTTNDLPAGSQAYQTYHCGGLTSTRRFGFGYYETYADLSPSTTSSGFHTSFWRYNANPGGYRANETDIFEYESVRSGGTGGPTQGIVDWNTTGPYVEPYINRNHPLLPWSEFGGGSAVPHTFGVLISPTKYDFYVDAVHPTLAPDYDGTVTTAGPYVPSEIQFASVGSAIADPHNAANTKQSWIQYDGRSTQTFNYSFQYFRYYQVIDAAMLRTQALPAGSIFIDSTVPSGPSTFTLSPAFSKYQPVAFPDSNPHNKYGPQGYLGQNAYASTSPGALATWSHQFSSADLGSASVGSYDVFVWNATVAEYQLPDTSANIYARDSAMNTTYEVQGSVGTAGNSQTINQTTSGQQWVPVNSSATATTYPTNTYAFTSGTTGSVQLTVGTESSIATDSSTFTPHTDADSVSFVRVYTYNATSADGYSDSGFSASGLTGWQGFSDSRYSTAKDSPTALATWNATLPKAGTYAVSAWSPVSSASTTYAYYRMNDGATQLGTAAVNEATLGGQWVPLGTFTWTGTSATVTVQNGNGTGNPANNYLRTNALKFVPEIPKDYIVCTDSTGIYGESLYSTSGAWTTTSTGSSLCTNNTGQTASAASASATFLPEVPVAGMYHAYIYNAPSLAATTKVTVNSHSSNPAVCDGIVTTGTQGWIYLGDYFFGPDSYPSSVGGGLTRDSIVVGSTGGPVSVSAVKLRYSGAPGTAANVCTNN